MTLESFLRSICISKPDLLLSTYSETSQRGVGRMGGGGGGGLSFLVLKPHWAALETRDYSYGHLLKEFPGKWDIL